MGVDNFELSEKETNDKLPEKVETSIKNIIKKEGYIHFQVVTKAISTGGGNFFGSLYEVDVKGQTEDGEKETNIFVKGIVDHGEHFTILSVTDIFNMELCFYNKISVVYDEIQNEAKIPVIERYNVAKSFQESIHEAIILDNLSRKGYKTLHRMDPISLEFAQLCIQQLGRFHGLSFALEKKRPNYFDRTIKSLSSPFNFNDYFKSLVTKSAETIAESLEAEPRSRFNQYIPNLWKNVQKYNCNKKYKRTLIHGDYRANNILMKEIDGEVIDVVPVDYQLMYYGCPLADFFYFIFLGTDQQLRVNHLNDLKDLYFDSLAKMLKHFDIDVKSVFPREDFENLYNELLDYGLFVFVNLMPFMFAVEGDVPELDRDDLADVRIHVDPRMKERARGIVDDFIRWGVL